MFTAVTAKFISIGKTAQKKKTLAGGKFKYTNLQFARFTISVLVTCTYYRVSFVFYISITFITIDSKYNV